ncbi:MAG: exodeoxyribonuclease VII small subunit [Lachnospiraceae bacterium]|nr:exodeoxyribonuclease VII small subunit [Lachnospiraceae bacterium]
MSEEKQLSLEEAFEKLETVIETLEQPDTSLEESFDAYKEGVALVNLCNQMIDRVEKEVRVLTEGGMTDEF